MTRTADRKDSHLDLARSCQSRSLVSHDLDRVQLEHNAMPECHFDDVELSARFLGHTLSMPIMIGAMTGGTDRADAINRLLAEIANETGIALAIGSQRASLEAGRDQSSLRALAPDIPIIGNLGGVQLAKPGGIDLARRAVDAIQADAMAIHLNPLQELAQPEGDRDWRGVEEAIASLCETLPCPVIVKEVGAGISASVAARLMSAGVSYVDAAGLGGTNWTRIETQRRDGDEDVFTPFLDWGIPTLDAIVQIRADLPDLGLIASGGIRHGLDAARALWIGADIVAAAGHFLTLAEDAEGRLTPDVLRHGIRKWKDQMRMSLFLTGSQNLAEFRRTTGTIKNF